MTKKLINTFLKKHFNKNVKHIDVFIFVPNHVNTTTETEFPSVEKTITLH